MREFNKINNKDWVLLISSYENNEYLKAKEDFKENKNIIFYGESNFEIKENYIASLISLYYQVILKILVLIMRRYHTLSSNYNKIYSWLHIKNSSGLLISDIKMIFLIL